MFTSLTLPRDLLARQPSCQWSLWALGVVFVNFVSPPFFGLKIDPVLDGFLDRFWAKNGPAINQKSIKSCFFFVAFFAMRFFFVFLRFLLNFRGLQTSKIMLPCTREHYFREIAVFVFGPPFGWILAHFCLISDPKTLQNGLRDPLEKKLTFGIYFIDFLVDLGTHLAPLGRSFSPTKRDIH